MAAIVKEKTKRKRPVIAPAPIPQPPLSRRFREGDINICPKCHSGIKTNFWGKKLGCRQPKCENYHG